MNTRFAASLTLLSLSCSAVLAAGEVKFENDLDKASYAVGLNVGKTWKRQELELNYDVFLRGLKDAMGDAEPALTEEEVRETLNKLQQELVAKQQEKRRQQGELNQKAAEAFLAENKNKPGVITLTNGLQYKVITEGSGDSPQTNDTVVVKYTGTLIDGTEFDSSGDATRTFRANQVIRGWTEALTRMKPGSKWRLFIPPDLAYGEFGRQPQIGPNAALVFDVELVSFTSPPPPAPVRSAPLTSDIIKVPSAEEMKKGAKIETIKAEDVEKLIKQQEELEKQKQKESESKSN